MKRQIIQSHNHTISQSYNLTISQSYNLTMLLGCPYFEAKRTTFGDQVALRMASFRITPSSRAEWMRSASPAEMAVRKSSKRSI